MTAFNFSSSETGCLKNWKRKWEKHWATVFHYCAEGKWAGSGLNLFVHGFSRLVCHCDAANVPGELKTVLTVHKIIKTNGVFNTEQVQFSFLKSILSCCFAIAAKRPGEIKHLKYIKRFCASTNYGLQAVGQTNKSHMLLKLCWCKESNRAHYFQNNIFASSINEKHFMIKNWRNKNKHSRTCHIKRTFHVYGKFIIHAL